MTRIRTLADTYPGTTAASVGAVLIVAGVALFAGPLAVGVALLSLIPALFLINLIETAINRRSTTDPDEITNAQLAAEIVELRRQVRELTADRTSRAAASSGANS